MAVVELRIESRVGDLDEARRRLGNSGVIRREMGDVLDEGARVGEHSMQLYAPERTRGLRGAIGSHPARVTETDGLEAAAGVGPVAGARGSRDYPYMVHEGTGLFGAYHRVIRPRTHRFMRFVGRTGLVYARQVAGQRPQPYAAEAFVDVVAYVEQRIDLMVRRIIGE